MSPQDAVNRLDPQHDPVTLKETGGSMLVDCIRWALETFTLACAWRWFAVPLGAVSMPWGRLMAVAFGVWLIVPAAEPQIGLPRKSGQSITIAAGRLAWRSVMLVVIAALAWAVSP